MTSPLFHYRGVTLYHGDCLDILPALNVSARAVVTDPPFGINYQNNFTRTKRSVLKGDEDFFSYEFWAKEAHRLLADDAAVFAYTGWSEYGHHTAELAAAGFTVAEPLIVQKRPAGGSLKASFQSNSDWIIFGRKGRFQFQSTRLVRNKKAGTCPNKGRPPVAEFKTRFPSCWFGSEYPYSTANPRTPEARQHPTAKSVELMEWLIKLTTRPDDLIIDPFAGSGPVLVAALRTGRRAIGIELERTHCTYIHERLQREANHVESA